MIKSLLVIICLQASMIMAAYGTDQRNEIIHGQEYCIAKQESECNEKDNNKVPEKTSDDIARCFRAAVFEYNRKDLLTCKETIEVNMATFAKAANTAANEGAKLIVYPEDGLYLGNETFVDPCLEQIPDPELLNSDNDIICDRGDFNDKSMLKTISCIAKENSIYIVANFGTKQTCDPSAIVGDKQCPQEGFFRLNTDVVFDSKGRYLRRYRKYNPFVEVFVNPPHLEHVYFDTPFGRFGVFTCFDIIFKSPAVDLVEKFHVDTVIFPTWWYDELPILTAAQFQDAWSWTNKVNFLGANIIRPHLGSIGSSIISGRNMVHAGADNTKSKVIIANLENVRSNRKCNHSFEQVILDIDERPAEETYSPKHYQLQTNDSYVIFSKLADKLTVCSNRICCNFDYQLAGDTSLELLDRLLVFARDGRRPGLYKWYEQVCAFASLKSSIDINQLNKTLYDSEAQVRFEKLSVSATFNSKYVYPYSGHNVSRLVSRDQRRFNCEEVNEVDDKRDSFRCRLDFIPKEGSGQSSVYSFGLYGRIYEDDLITY